MLKVKINSLMIATVALTQYDTQTRFELLASKGNKKRGLELLNKLDEAYKER